MYWNVDSNFLWKLWEVMWLMTHCSDVFIVIFFQAIDQSFKKENQKKTKQKTKNRKQTKKHKKTTQYSTALNLISVCLVFFFFYFSLPHQMMLANCLKYVLLQKDNLRSNTSWQLEVGTKKIFSLCLWYMSSM